MSAGLRQTNTGGGYFINVGSLIGKVSAYNPTTGLISTAFWATSTTALMNSATSSALHTAGSAVLRDLGKTLVSSNRTFRKVQLLGPFGGAGAAAYASTGGVGGLVGSAAGEDWLTGYIELGYEGTGQAAPVARFGR